MKYEKVAGLMSKTKTYKSLASVTKNRVKTHTQAN